MQDCSPEELAEACRFTLEGSVVRSDDPDHAESNRHIEWALDSVEFQLSRLDGADLETRGRVWEALCDIWESDVVRQADERDFEPPSIAAAAAAGRVLEALVGVVEPDAWDERSELKRELWHDATRVREGAEAMAYGHFRHPDHLQRLSELESRAGEIEHAYLFGIGDEDVEREGI